MNTRYREIQHFHPIVYWSAGAAVAGSAGLGLLKALIGAALWSATLGGTSFLVLFVLAALGRIVVTVDSQRLVVSFGWLHWIYRSFDLADIDGVRVCVFDPSTGGWGQRAGLDAPTCYAGRGGRGVEITTGGKRYVIGSGRPAELKRAMLGDDGPPDDDRPDYLRESVASFAGQRRVSAGYSSWGLL